jgi:hypothetical protein
MLLLHACLKLTHKTNIKHCLFSIGFLEEKSETLNGFSLNLYPADELECFVVI